MSTPQFDQFWRGVAAREESSGRTFPVQARFAADVEGKTPVTIVLEDDEPFVVVDEKRGALRDALDLHAASAPLAPNKAT